MYYTNTTTELNFEYDDRRKKKIPNEVQSKHAWDTIPSYNQNVARNFE